MKLHRFTSIAILTLALAACRGDEVVFIPEVVPVAPPQVTGVDGFYLLNEGNMGSNKSTLDYFDYATGDYTRNIYSNVNPDVPKELGDVGNDLAIYGSRLYAVINCSNKVEVMDEATCRRIGQIEVPNCRYIAFHEGYAYVTSYAGPVEINPDYRQKGYVARIDTATLAETGRCIVGYQPNGIAYCDGRLYVANSGGYLVPNYEKTVSVIDVASFEVTNTIEVAENLDMVLADQRSRIWISAIGDYYGCPPGIYCYDPASGNVIHSLDFGAVAWWLDGDMLYVVTSALSGKSSFVVVDTESGRIVDDCFITDGTQGSFKKPYGVAVDPISKDIYVTDAGNYVNPGYVHCYSPEGVRRWSVRAGDIPAHFAFRLKYDKQS